MWIRPLTLTPTSGRLSKRRLIPVSIGTRHQEATEPEEAARLLAKSAIRLTLRVADAILVPSAWTRRSALEPPLGSCDLLPNLA